MAATSQADGASVVHQQWALVELEDERVVEWYDTLIETYAQEDIVYQEKAASSR
jgi:hypothetical protein